MSEVTKLSNGFAAEIPMEKKMELVRAYVSLGNMRLASEMVGVNPETGRYWKRTKEWWPKAVEEVKQEQRQELQGRLNKITETALSIMEDRLKNGEYILNIKTGDIIRKPVGLRDANQAANNLMTQATKLEEMNSKSHTVDESTAEVLKQLANEFAKFAKKKVNTEIVDVEAKEI